MRGNEPENNSQYEKGGADVNAFLPPMFFLLSFMAGGDTLEWHWLWGGEF